jgi:hypothetical protein
LIEKKTQANNIEHAKMKAQEKGGNKYKCAKHASAVPGDLADGVVLDPLPRCGSPKTHSVVRFVASELSREEGPKYDYSGGPILAKGRGCGRGGRAEARPKPVSRTTNSAVPSLSRRSRTSGDGNMHRMREVKAEIENWMRIG